MCMFRAVDNSGLINVRLTFVTAEQSFFKTQNPLPKCFHVDLVVSKAVLRGRAFRENRQANTSTSCASSEVSQSEIRALT